MVRGTPRAVPLTEQQLQVLRTVSHLDAEPVPLAGGAALIVAGFVDRVTRDLDFFTNNVDAVGPFADQLIEALEAQGSVVRIIRRSAGFVQMQSGDVLIDIAHTYLDDDPVQSEIGLRCADTDLVGGKVEALFARRVNRDILDVAQLLDHYDIAELTGMAQERDAGFSIPITIEMVTGSAYDAKQGFLPSEFEMAKSRVLSELQSLLEDPAAQ